MKFKWKQIKSMTKASPAPYDHLVTKKEEYTLKSIFLAQVVILLAVLLHEIFFFFDLWGSGALFLLMTATLWLSVPMEKEIWVSVMTRYIEQSNPTDKQLWQLRRQLSVYKSSKAL